MASFEEIKRRAFEEKPLTPKFWVNEMLKNYPFNTKSGCKGFYIPDIDPQRIEKYCDNRGIPCYYVAEDSITIGNSYSELYEFERRR